MTSSRRRWFSFSLRTLFVVVTALTVPLGWFANQVTWMQQRWAAFDEMVGDRPLLRDPDFFHGSYSAETPSGLSLIYAEGLGFSDLWVHPDRYESDRARIQRLFPEARIHRNRVRLSQPASQADRP